MARFLTIARGDKSALRLATLFQMTYPGAPSIYYGDEIGMAGRHDPDNRGAFPWHRTDSWDTELLHDFQRYIALRKSFPALRRGAFRFLHANNGVVAYLRSLEDQRVVVILNASAGARTLDIPLRGALTDGTVLEECWSHAPARADGESLRGVSLAPQSGRVFTTPASR